MSHDISTPFGGFMERAVAAVRADLLVAGNVARRRSEPGACVRACADGARGGAGVRRPVWPSGSQLRAGDSLACDCPVSREAHLKQTLQWTVSAAWAGRILTARESACCSGLQPQSARYCRRGRHQSGHATSLLTQAQFGPPVQLAISRFVDVLLSVRAPTFLPKHPPGRAAGSVSSVDGRQCGRRAVRKAPDRAAPVSTAVTT